MEVVLIELSDEACEIAVLEVFGQDGFGEPLVLQSHEQVHSTLRTLDADVPQGRQNYRLRLPIGRLASTRGLLTFFRRYQPLSDRGLLLSRASYLYSLRT